MLLLMTGCERIEDLLYEGTQIGVERCVHRTKTTIVGAELAQRICLAKHQRPIEEKVLTGRAGYRFFSGATIFSGRVSNDSSDVITTGFAVTVAPDGTGKTASKIYHNLALRPEAAEDIYISAEDLKDASPASADSKFNWNIVAVKGIRIVTR